MKKIVILFVLLALVLASCGQGQMLGPTPTPLPTNTPTPTDPPTPTSTPMPTNTPTPTSTPTPSNTPTPTPTINPLNSKETLAEIVLQEEDLEEFYQQIGRDLDKLRITQTNPYMTKWGAPIPPGIVNSYSAAFDTRRVDPGNPGGMPQLSAFHNTAIFVFPDSDSAHTFFLLDTKSMDQGLILDIPTIGDESVAFSGYLKDKGWPIGGVIWRYHEVYVFVSAQLFFRVTPDSITKIAQNIQDRLVEIID